MSTKTYPIIGTKSNLLWDEDSDAWVYISGEPHRDNDPRQYWKIIPTLYRAVDARASAIANLPWVIMQGDNEYDSSVDYQNKTGLVSSMSVMLYLIEASLTLAGSSYWKWEKNVVGYQKLRHLNPVSMKLDEDKARNGEIVWKRNENSVTKTYTPEEIVYIWYPDPYVEIGPPSSWPVQSALTACGVLANLDEFAKSYFARGAIKAMIFSMSGATRDNAAEFESWWNRWIAGIRNVFRTKVVNADNVTPVIVGEGIKELENVSITSEKREEIALSMSIPMSILFANAANYATAERDKLNWYEDKIVPEAKFIASLLNEQIYEPLGLQFKFLPETLDIFQQDETERAEAMSRFIDAVIKAESIEMAKAMFKIYGFEIDDEAMGYIEQHFASKAERAEAMPTPPTYQPETMPTREPEVEEEPVRRLDLQQIGRELSLWQSKCIKAMERGDSAADVAFVPVAIPTDVFKRVCDGIESAADVDGLKQVFACALNEPESVKTAQPDAILALVGELRRQNDIFIWKGYP